MGIQLKTGVVYGKVGSVIYRRWRGMNVVQGIAKQCKQSVSTRAAAKEFGMASSTSASIRKSLALFYHQEDLEMKNRLTRQVLRAIQHSPQKERLERDIHDADLRHLAGFQFNENCPLEEALGVHPWANISTTGAVELHIPAFKQTNILFHGEHSFVTGFKLRAVVIVYDFREQYANVVAIKDVRVEKEMAALQIALCGKQPAGKIVMVGLALYAEQHTGMDCVLLNSRNWSPAAILGCMHTEEEEPELSEEQAEALELTPKAGNADRYMHPGCSKDSISSWLLTAYRSFRASLQELGCRKSARDELKKGMILLE